MTEQHLKDLIAAQGKRITTLSRRVTRLEKAPALRPSGKFVIMKDGDAADKWFATEEALLQMNSTFHTVAYDEDGRVMRRFSPARDWASICPSERLRIA